METSWVPSVGRYRRQIYKYLRFEVLTAVKIWIVVLWMTPCSLVGGYQLFGGT
jgi:hypothetical protein